HTQFVPSHPAETVNPLAGLSGTFGAPNTTPIPAPSSTGSTVAGQPTASFNLLPANKRVMTIYNGTFPGPGALAYVSEGSLTDNGSSTSLEINFTATDPTVVLAWGAH